MNNKSTICVFYQNLAEIQDIFTQIVYNTRKIKKTSQPFKEKSAIKKKSTSNFNRKVEL